MTEKAVGTIVIDNELNDDWMKQLPGYQDEVAITEGLFKKEPVKKKVKLTLKKKE